MTDQLRNINLLSGSLLQLKEIKIPDEATHPRIELLYVTPEKIVNHTATGDELPPPATKIPAEQFRYGLSLPHATAQKVIDAAIAIVEADLKEHAAGLSSV